MAEKTEKVKQSSTPKHIPKDAQVIMSIMKDTEIKECEPRVINMLLEFTYSNKRYVVCVLEDAKSYGNHAKKKSIDVEDIKLALKIQLEQTYTLGPPRDMLTELARTCNSIPLPAVKPHCGLRLPHDRHCLSSSNLKIKLPPFSKKTVRVTTQYSGSFTDRNLKMASKMNLGVLKRANNLPLMARTQTISIPRPLPKFTNIPPKAVPKPKIHITQSNLKTEPIDEAISLKRKREYDNYDMNL